MTLIVTIDRSEPLARVTARLEAAGLTVTNALELLHIITVDGDEAALARVHAVVGVISARPDGEVRIDPGETPDMGPDFPRPTRGGAAPDISGASWRSPAWDRPAG